MNDEKALLIEKCLGNPILKVVLAAIASMPEEQGRTRVPTPRLIEETGLTEIRCKEVVSWLLKKGLLKASHEHSSRNRAAIYFLDDEFRDVFRNAKFQKFGATSRKILEPFDTSRSRAAAQVIFCLNSSNQSVDDEYGTPLDVDEARRYRDTLSRYIGMIEEFGESKYEEHRRSRQNLTYWGGRHRAPSYTRPPAIACGCTKCKSDYQVALAAWTRYRDHKNREQRLISDSIKAIR